VTTLAKAIYQSCDVYFYDLAHTLGIDRMHQFMSQFGFGTSTGIDIAGELTGLMPSRAWKRATHRLPWFPGETIITGIGQGFMLTTPLQLAFTTATLANRGAPVRPRLAHAIQILGKAEPDLLQSLRNEQIAVVKASNWETIIDAMEQTAHNPRGTAWTIGKDAPYRIAGKTGTAQVFGLKEDEKYVKEDVALRLRDHALFIAFAPADDPQIAIAVIVENGGSGGLTAARVARAVMDKFLSKGAT
jgi:penicillin-binding protein 2